MLTRTITHIAYFTPTECRDLDVYADIVLGFDHTTWLGRPWLRPVPSSGKIPLQHRPG